MAEKADDALNRLFKTVKVTERRIDLQGPVHENTAEPRVLGGIHQLGLADGRNHALGRSRVHRRVSSAGLQVFPQRQAVLPLALVCLSIEVEDAVLCRHLSSPLQSAHCSEIKPKK